MIFSKSPATICMLREMYVFLGGQKELKPTFSCSLNNLVCGRLSNHMQLLTHMTIG